MAPLLISLRPWPARWAAHMPPVMICTPPLGHSPLCRSRSSAAHCHVTTAGKHVQYSRPRL
eukprot:174861-Pyramimonas_sp.AAC.1